MLHAIVLGTGLGFAAAIQPGPLQALLLSRVLAVGARRTLPAALAPLLSDGPIALLVLLVLRTMPGTFVRGLRIAGGLFLIYLAWSAVRQARAHPAPDAGVSRRQPQTLLQAALLNLVNPNPYLGWALVIGPAALAAWRTARSDAVALVASLYLTMVLVLAVFIVLCGSARALSPRVQRSLMVASALALGMLGVWQLWVGVFAT